MNWLEQRIVNICRLPWYLVFAHFVSRTVMGIGIGFLLAAYTQSNPRVHGWTLLAIGILIGAPTTRFALRKTRAPK